METSSRRMPKRSQYRHQATRNDTKDKQSIDAKAQSDKAKKQYSTEIVSHRLRKRTINHSELDKNKSKREKKNEPDGMISNFICNFGARAHPPQLHTSHILSSLQKSINLVHYLHGSSYGKVSCQNRKSILHPLKRELEELSLFRKACPFDRRVTALEWHPSLPGFLAAGSKGGDIIVWDTMHLNLNDKFIRGIGPGGSIQAIKFWPWDTNKLVTASIDGRVTLNNFEGRPSETLTDGLCCMDCWYCSVDVSAPRKVLVTGGNTGNTILISSEGKRLWTHRLHKQKVTHVEFSPREDWLLCTASVDHTVKMWDIRMVSGRESALQVLKHDRSINSAYFSLTDGCRLLTTDQHSQLRVYRAPEWTLERTVTHPHRFFQHLTPIKASWHPLHDLIVVGRYPDKEFPGYVQYERRTVDIIDANTGDIVTQLNDFSTPGIISLNKFNNRGDFLASGMGLKLLLWGHRKEVEELHESLLEEGIQNGLDSLLPGTAGHTGQSSSSSERVNHERKASKEISKTKETPQTKTKSRTRNPR